MKGEFQEIPPLLWVAIGIALLAQGTLLFIDARKHSKYPWFWGIWGMIGFPLPTIFYLLIVRQIWRRKRRDSHD